MFNEELEELEKEVETDESGFDTDYEVVQPKNVNRLADRYIFFAGDLMGDEQKRSRVDFRMGGEYFGHEFPALAISKYVLHRARITPITLAPRPLSSDEHLVNQQVQTYADGEIQFKGEAPARIQHVKTFPGDQLEAIVFGARDGAVKGFVELTAFKGMKWSLPETQTFINEVQNLYFPNWKAILKGDTKLPDTLRGLNLMIAEALVKHSSDQQIAQTGSEMLISCDQFRTYGISYLEKEATRIRAGVNQNGGYVHTYSPIANVLLRQLEMKRENLIELQNINTPKESERSADAILEMAAAMREQNKLIMESNQQLIQAVLAGQGRTAPRSKPKQQAAA